MAEEWDLGDLLKIGSNEQPVSSRDGSTNSSGKTRREDENGEENAQKKARTTNDESGSLVDFIANMDFTGFFDDDKEGDIPGDGMGAAEEHEKLPFSVMQQVTKLADSSNEVRDAEEHHEDFPYVVQEPCSRLKTPEQGQKLTYTIPGPAGATQLGISNKGQENMILPKNVDDTSDRSDYRSRAWLKALEYFHISEIDPVKFSQRDSTISHIKSSGVDRVPQMIAIIKTCTPNGNGDAYVTLKDPTGTINGTIHRRLLAETEFGRDIVPDAAILLCKVAVFRPCPRAHYLNITMNNVVQVFRNDRLG